MIFSSFTFLFHFLPIFLLVYYLVPFRFKNTVIFIGSLFFYFYGIKEHPIYLLLILLSIFINYVCALYIQKGSCIKARKFWIFTGMFYNFGSLFIFKYLDFFCENINVLLTTFHSNLQIPYVKLVLPIGISFYTFQISSYLFDVYRGKIKAERSLLTLGTYLCLFPQLIAGPIVTYTEIQEQLHNRAHSLQLTEEGMREFTIGLALKVLIANRIGSVWTQASAIGYENISTPLAWLALIAFSLQIYFDFYGYSLMAKGLGMMMGFHFPDNFRNPYLARSVSDFWRRWHITLGSWFREYVYIPLGGNRQKVLRNLLFVWCLTGLWHGASWNYVLWGLLSFAFITLERRKLGSILASKPVFGRLYMLGFILFSWLLFAVTDFSQLGVYLTRLFPFWTKSSAIIFKGDFRKQFIKASIPLFAGLFCCTGLPRKLYEQKKYSLGITLILVLLFWLCVYSMYLGLDDPFLYYQF